MDLIPKTFTKVIFRNNYKNALKSLQDLLARKKKEGPLRHNATYYAQQISKSYSGVDAKTLADLVKEDYLCEAVYAGNIGIMELMLFNKKANDKEKQKLRDLIKNKKTSDAWKLVQDVTKVKFHKSITESHQEFKSKAGAGEDGSGELLHRYQKDTPGQPIKSFTKYINSKK